MEDKRAGLHRHLKSVPALQIPDGTRCSKVQNYG